MIGVRLDPNLRIKKIIGLTVEGRIAMGRVGLCGYVTTVLHSGGRASTVHRTGHKFGTAVID